MPPRVADLFGLCLLTLACIVAASCAASRPASARADDLWQSAPFAEVASTIATLQSAKGGNVSTWENTPAVEVVGQLLADTGFTIWFHEEVDQHRLVSGTLRDNLAMTLDDIARQIGAKWHPSASAVCFDSMDGDSVDARVTVRYRIRVDRGDTGSPDTTSRGTLIRFLVREVPGAEITGLQQNGPEMNVTMRAFVATHLLFLLAQDYRVEHATLLEK
jgi:hypothetical protein